MAESGGSCIICKVSFKSNDEEVVCLRQKGAEGINSWAEKRGDSFGVAAGDTVHKVCRKNYTKELPSNIAQPKEDAKEHSTRSSTEGFDFNHNCFLCGQARIQRGDLGIYPPSIFWK